MWIVVTPLIAQQYRSLTQKTVHHQVWPSNENLKDLWSIVQMEPLKMKSGKTVLLASNTFFFTASLFMMAVNLYLLVQAFIYKSIFWIDFDL